VWSGVGLLVLATIVIGYGNQVSAHWPRRLPSPDLPPPSGGV